MGRQTLPIVILKQSEVSQVESNRDISVSAKPQYDKAGIQYGKADI